MRWRFGPAAAAHGREWRLLMKQAGFPARACHDYPIEGLRRRQYYYAHVCTSCGARAIRRASLRLSCRRCGPAAKILVLRAPRDQAGLRRLKSVTLAECQGQANEA